MRSTSSVRDRRSSDGRQHLVEISFRAQFASEFHQCAAIVVARAVEELIDSAPGCTSAQDRTAAR